MLEEFEILLSSLEAAKSTRRSNEAMDALMAHANILVDNVVSNVVTANLGKVSQEIKALLLESSTVLVHQLSYRFQIPMNALERAVVIRVNEFLQQNHALTSAQENRAPTIGFGQRAVATTESPAEFRIGFEIISKKNELAAEDEGPIPIGFDLGQSKRASQDAEDVVAIEEISLNLSDPEPVGFKHFVGKDVEHYLVLNHHTGYFEIHFQNQQPLGFLLRPK